MMYFIKVNVKLLSPFLFFFAMAVNLTIGSINVNGLHDFNKRNETFNFIRHNNLDILLIQETLSEPQLENHWKNDWEGLSLWNSGPVKRSSGVAFLFKKGLNIQID